MSAQFHTLGLRDPYRLVGLVLKVAGYACLNPQVRSCDLQRLVILVLKVAVFHAPNHR